MGYLKEWLAERIAWMDQQLGFDPDVWLRGDVNCDGFVTITDVTDLINYLLSDDAMSVPLESADCDLDGKANISDVTALIAYLLSGSW